MQEVSFCVEQCSGLVGDAWYPIAVHDLGGREGDLRGEAELPVLAGWEQLGNEGPWSGVQKGKQRVRDSSFLALHPQLCAGACQSKAECELKVEGLFSEGENSIQKVKEVFNK